MSGSVFVSSTQLSVSETVGTAYEIIKRTGSLDGDVVITCGLTADTATAGQDYTGTFFTVTMAAGVDQIEVPVTILDDALAESTETLTFSIVSVENATLFAPRTSLISILDDETPAPPPPAEPPLTSPYDVAQVPVVTGLDQPIRIEFSPIDPTLMYVPEKPGAIQVVDLDTGITTTLLDIRDKVNDSGDRGLLDIALHPDLVHNPYLYVTVIIDPPETAGLTGLAGPDGTGNRYVQLIRYTLDAATGYTTVVDGSETILLGGAGQSLYDISGNGAEDFTGPGSTSPSSERYMNPTATEQPLVIDGIKQDYWKIDSASHVGGSLAFGPDGALYVGVGDGASFDYADPRTPDVQNLNSLSGKILRIDPITGLGLPDNPFVTPGMDLDTNQAKVFQLGLRNPFTLAFDDAGRLFISDTGWFSWEEINSGGPGANFGWPFYEGGDGGVLVQTPGFGGFPDAAAFYAAVENGNLQITPAYRAFAHDGSQPGFQVQAITGGQSIYDGTVYPSSLLNSFFFVDFPEGEVYTVNVDDRTDVKFLYQHAGFGAPTDFAQGADGYIYYADLVGGVIGRLDISAATTGPLTRTIGTGADSLVLKISQDAYLGDALYTISVDGVQIGGTLAAKALHSSGESDIVTVLGDWAPGAHTVAVEFLNDAWGGSADTDRNLYVDGITYDGAVLPGGTAMLAVAGPQAFDFTDTGSGTTPPPPPSGGGGVTIGTGADTLVVKISQDAYLGNARYTVTVDGVQIGGVLEAGALHSSGTSDTVNVLGDWAPGTHVLAVDFVNDLYGGTTASDRNLYVNGITYDGVAVAGGTAAMFSGGAKAFGFTDTGSGTTPPQPPPSSGGTVTIGTGADTLALKISEDAYLGDAQFTVSVDGVQIGGTLTAHALHSSGTSDTVNVLGDWAPGTHVLAVDFVNDLYGGTTASDRNLYVDAITYDGVAVAGGTAAMFSGGAKAFSFSDIGSGTPPPPAGTTDVGTGAQTMVLKLNQDAYLGNAQYTLKVDGVQVGGVLQASALHSSGTSDTINLHGTWAAGQHTVTVTFLNDAWGGSLSLDRNLYVQSLDYGTTHLAGNLATNTAANSVESLDPASAVMAINGTADFQLLV